MSIIYLARLNRSVGCFQAIFLGLMLFLLTAGLCWISAYLIQVNPLFGVIFLFLGSMGVLLAVDIIQARIFQ
ncbi:hypothetical protein AB3R30_18620 [Leptolyngbyaceae cyanobacterium UHCC 1019]